MTRRSSFVLCVLLALGVGCGGEPVATPQHDTSGGSAERAFWDLHDRARKAVSAGELDRAATLYAEALEKKPDHVASLYALAGLRRELGEYDEALSIVDRLVTRDRPKTRALLLRAAIRSDIERVLSRPAASVVPNWFDLTAARAAAAEAARINPEETGTHLAVGRIELLRHHPALAIKALTRVIELHPGHADAHVLMSVAYERIGESAAAKDSAERAEQATRPAAGSDGPARSREGDTASSVAKREAATTQRLRALAQLLRIECDWPADAPARPPVFDVPSGIGTSPSGTPQRAVAADLDGDGQIESLRVPRAPETLALRSLFGVELSDADVADHRVSLLPQGRPATPLPGLPRLALCARDVQVRDLDSDGDIDILVLPGDGDPLRREPPVALLNDGAGAFTLHVARLSASNDMSTPNNVSTPSDQSTSNSRTDPATEPAAETQPKSPGGDR